MNTTKTTAIKSAPTALASTLASVLLVALLGSTLLFLAGHAQSATLHDVAHDMRHATGFPCH